jgi:NADPH-dependent glutamate synthase beta subunit-like oxidoreductase
MACAAAVVSRAADVPGEQLRREFDAIVLCGGATLARDLAVPGRDLAGIHLAMEFLHRNTKSLLDSEWVSENGRFVPREIAGTERTWPATLVLLALGFLGPERGGMLDQLGVTLDARGNVETGPDKQTKAKGVFAAGDMRRGQSLVVWAIAEGRQAAESVDRWLKAGGRSVEPGRLGAPLRPAGVASGSRPAGTLLGHEDAARLAPSSRGRLPAEPAGSLGEGEVRRWASRWRRRPAC